MSDATWTERQKREASFYERYAERQRVERVDFAPVDGRERRPWNPYWCVYEQARNRFVGPWQRLLDFGCGVGIAGVRFAHIGYRVDGFDISAANVSAAAALADRVGLSERCAFREMVAERLDYPDDTFDLIAGIDILHHVEIAQAVAEARRVLKPGGVAIFKEHVEVPVFEAVRNTGLVRAVAPREESLDHHITHDERKLNRGDIDLITSSFRRVETIRFTLLGRLDRFLPNVESARQKLQRLDHRMMRACPPLAKLGGTVVLICHK